MPAGFHRCRFSLPPEAEDELVAELWCAGTTGVEIRTEADGSLTALAFFPQPPALEESDWLRLGAALDGIDLVPDEDWMAAYRARARPLALGRGFLVDPRDPDRGSAAAGGRRLLRIPARTAFGTGSHPSTRLACELLEDLPLAGSWVLDVGTGTGILALAAACLGAAGVVALDTDPQAAMQAHENRRRNGIGIAVVAARLGALGPRASFDVALVNIVPALILPELPQLVSVLSPAGRVVLSGLTGGDREELLPRLSDLGLAPAGRRREGDWLALLLERAGS